MRWLLVRALSEEVNLKTVDEYLEVDTKLKCLPSEKEVDHISAAILKEGGSGSEFFVRLPYSELKPGMSLRQDISTKSDEVLLKNGHVLSVVVINRLQEIQDVLQSDAVWVFNPPQS